MEWIKGILEWMEWEKQEEKIEGMKEGTPMEWKGNGIRIWKEWNGQRTGWKGMDGMEWNGRNEEGNGMVYPQMRQISQQGAERGGRPNIRPLPPSPKKPAYRLTAVARKVALAGLY